MGGEKQRAEHKADAHEHEMARHHARDWMLAAFADDLAIVAHPEIAARVYYIYFFIGTTKHDSLFN